MRARLAGWVFAGPALLALAVFFFVPVAAAFVLSLTDFDIYAVASLENVRFIGADNYLRLLQTPLFWKALGNTGLFVALGVPLSVGTSLGTALLLDAAHAKLQGFFRTALFSPVVTTLVGVAVIWRYLLHTRYGLINHGLSLLGIHPVDWLGDPRWSMPAIVLFAVWKSFGYNMVILLAALQTIPDELYEASRLEGASALQQARMVTLPLIAPTLLLVSTLTMAGYFQLFAEPYVMTQGGPLQSTTSVLYFMYDEGFKWWNLGAASAVAFLLFAIILAVTAGQAAAARRLRWSEES